jgi:hypothetical protein
MVHQRKHRQMEPCVFEKSSRTRGFYGCRKTNERSTLADAVFSSSSSLGIAKSSTAGKPLKKAKPAADTDVSNQEARRETAVKDVHTEDADWISFESSFIKHDTGSPRADLPTVFYFLK